VVRLGKAAKLKETLQEAMVYSQKNVPVIPDCVTGQHRSTRAVTGSVYGLSCAIPWDEVPPRGKAPGALYLKHWFPGLKDEAGWNAGNPWEPPSNDEFGYTPRDDYFKA
jgi:hypothetical protein